MAARVRTSFVILLGLALAVPTLASGPDETLRSPAALTELEHRADTASPRDQCALYTELAHSLMEVAGQQLKDGDEKAAEATLARIDRLAVKIRAAAVADARRLQNAEMLMEHTTHRLSDMMHLASTEERAAMKATLDHLNQVHTQMLAAVFAQ